MPRGWRGPEKMTAAVPVVCGRRPAALEDERFRSLLSPGRMEVVHREERDGRFSFTLTVRHRWFGELIHQVAFFRDAPAP